MVKTRSFIQYVKMTQDIDVITVSTDKAILPQFKDEFENKMKHIHLGVRSRSNGSDINR